MKTPHSLQPNDIKKFIESYFKPLKCKADFDEFDSDYKEYIRFKVLDDNKNIILEEPRLHIHPISTIPELEKVLAPYKQKIRNKGYAID